MRNFINFYFEFEYRNHRTIKRDVKLQFGDAIVSRLEANKQTLDTMHNLALNLKNTVGVGSSDPRSEVPTPIESVLLRPTKGPRPAKNTWAGSSDLGSKVPTHPSEVSCSFR